MLGCPSLSPAPGGLVRLACPCVGGGQCGAARKDALGTAGCSDVTRGRARGCVPAAGAGCSLSATDL